MNPTEYLTREERIRQIGELLSKGVTLMLIREAEAQRTQEANAPWQEQTPQLAEVSNDQAKSSPNQASQAGDASGDPSGPRSAGPPSAA